MTIIEIKKNASGGHDNFTGDNWEFPVLDGWAVIPESVGTPDTLKNFPFGDVETKVIDGVMTVTKWIPGTVPEAVELPPSEMEKMRADIDFIALMKGVDL